MDDSGFVSVNIGMNIGNSQPTSSAQIIQQLPGIQQIFTQNAPVKQSEALQNVIQQTVVPISGQAGIGNQSVLLPSGQQGNASVLAQTGLQFIGQTAQTPFIGQQQLLTDQSATQQQVNIGARGLVAGNYQIPGRNYAVVNQGVAGGTGVTVQLSPHQLTTSLGPASLSPMDQQQLIPSAAFDPQLAALQQNQTPQHVTFQGANGQLMIQSPSQQLVLQSPNPQFTLQSPTQQFNIQNQNLFPNQSANVAQFASPPQIIPHGQGNNVILQGQNSSMIVQGDNFLQSSVNPNMFLQNPIIQNVNPQIYGSTPNVINAPLQGMSQVLTNQSMGMISINQSPGNLENIDKSEPLGQPPGAVNQQMQLLAQIAQQTSPDCSNQSLVSNVAKENQQTVNVNQPQAMTNTANTNQSLPSFGHFLLHHHMQSLPHPFLQNLSIASFAPIQSGRLPEPDSNQVQNTKPAVPDGSSNINAEFNNWNKGQLHSRNRKTGSPARSIAPNLLSKSPNILPTAAALTSVQTISCDSKCAVTMTTTVVCSSSKINSGRVKPVTSQFQTRPALLRPTAVKLEQPNFQLPQSGASHSSVVVPYGWVRVVEGDFIVYYSPTYQRLTSKEKIRQYLSSDGTCKCGLQCPLHLDQTFNFDVKVVGVKCSQSDNPPSLEMSLDEGSTACKHKHAQVSGYTAMRPVTISTRQQVSMVTSSAMMSPRVSIAIHENTANTTDKVKPEAEGVEAPLVESHDKQMEEKHLSKLDKSPISPTAQSVHKQLTSTKAVAVSTKLDRHVISSDKESTPVQHSDHLPNVITVSTAEGEDVIHSNDGNTNSRISLADCVSSTKDAPEIGEHMTTKIMLGIPCTDNVYPRAEDASYTELKDKKSDKPGRNVTIERDDVSLTKSHSLIAACLSKPVQGTSETLSHLKTEKKPVPLAASVKSTVGPLSVMVSKNISAGVARPQNLAQPTELSNHPELDMKSYHVKNDTFRKEMFSHLMNFCGMEQTISPCGGPDYTQGPLQTAAPGVDILPHAALKTQHIGHSVLNSFQANLVANLNKLSSPQNQKMFPEISPTTNVADSTVVPVSSVSLPKCNTSAIPRSDKLAQSVLSTPDILGIGVPHGLNPSDFFGEKATQLFEMALLNSKCKSDSGAHVRHKADNLYDASVPPPNVDVSVLEDKGHGLIPKELILPVAESNVETAVVDPVKSAISSTSSSPRPDNDLPETKSATDHEESSQTTSENVDCRRSDSACSDRLSSSVIEETTDDENIKQMQVTSGCGTSMTCPQNIPVNLTTARATNPALVDTSLTCTENKSQTKFASSPIMNTSEECTTNPALQSLPTPTTVVHHTASSLSCHQMSLNKARQQLKSPKPGTSQQSAMLTDASILNPLMAVLNDPTIGHAFRQMFPEVMQEAIVQSSTMQPTNDTTVLTRSVEGETQKDNSKFKANQLQTTLNDAHMKSTITPTLPNPSHTTQRPKFGMQDMMNSVTHGEFPASSLLTAAAKAQFVQQHNQLLTNQVPPAALHSNPVPVVNQDQPLLSVSGLGNSQTVSTSKGFNSAEAHATAGQSIVDPSVIRSNQEKIKVPRHPLKISELLNRSAPSKVNVGQRTSSTVALSHVNTLSQTPLNVNTTSKPCVSIANPLAFQSTATRPLAMQSKANMLGHSGNVTGQALSHVQGSSIPQPEQLKYKPEPGQVNMQLMNMYSALGLPLAVGNNSNSTQHLPNKGDSSTIPPSGHLFNLQNPLQNTAANYKVPVQNLGVPFLHQRPQISNLSNAQGPLPQDVQNVLSMLCPPGVNPAFVNLPVNPGVNPASVPVTAVPRPQVPQMVLTSQGVDIQNTSHTQDPMLAANPLNPSANQMLPLNVINVQQTFGNGGSNLTAMQLQTTLQLQQQLLQQIQQIQGMQTLINQINMQGVSPVNTTATAKGVTVTSIAGMQVTSPVATANTGVISPASRPNVQTNVTVRQRKSSETKISSSDHVTSNVSQVTRPPLLQASSEHSPKKYSRVIAAADTTAECSPTTTKVDVAIETDQLGDCDDEDDDKSVISTRSDEPHCTDTTDHTQTHVNVQDSDCDEVTKHVSEAEDDECNSTKTSARLEGGSCSSDSSQKNDQTLDVSNDCVFTSTTSEETCSKNGENKAAPESVISPSKTETVTSSPDKPITTCLAIATEKGNWRSRKMDNKSLKQRSSLAKSQNLAAELAVPTEGELKLRISRKHILGQSLSDIVLKKRRKKVKTEDSKSSFEKKELRSSTQAATKASTMLAAASTSTFSENKSQKSDKDTAAVSTGADKDNSDASSSLNTAVSKATGTKNSGQLDKMIEEKAAKLNVSADECDSSNCVESEDNLKTDSDTEATLGEDKPQAELTSKIATALSNQKGQWLLSNLKKKADTSSEEGLAPSTADSKGVKRIRDDATGSEDVPPVKDNMSVSAITFASGDLVWGQIRGFPSWPGKLVDGTQGTPAEEGKLLVKWFGDNTVTQVEPDKLKTLSEGLEAHHRARKKHRRGRKMNSNLEQAIQQAMAELDKQTAQQVDVELHSKQVDTDTTKPTKSTSKLKK